MVASTGTRFAGIVPILQTPFDDSGALDLDSLRTEIEFCVRAGVHGVVIPANASEFFTLSDAERMRVTEIALEEARGRLPVIVSANGVSSHAAVAFTRHAVAHGADGIMVLPPYVRRAGEAGVHAYYEAVAAAADGRPVIVQNAEPPLGTPLAIPSLVKLIERVPNIRYVKEEVNPGGQRMSALIRAAGERLDGVFDGLNEIWLLGELDRGACGNMPNCALADVQAQSAQSVPGGPAGRRRGTAPAAAPVARAGEPVRRRVRQGGAVPAGRDPHQGRPRPAGGAVG